VDARTAASLDHWLTTPPEPAVQPLPGDDEYPRCVCGSFLKLEPGRTEGKVQESLCTGYDPWESEYGPECGDAVRHGEHVFVAAAWDEAHRVCARCGHDNVEVLA
jgi:hypothetical protein